MKQDYRHIRMTLTTFVVLVSVFGWGQAVSAVQSENLWKSVELDNAAIQVTGARFATRTAEEIVFHRFSSDTLTLSKSKLNFNIKKANCTTGAVVHLATESPEILLRFELISGEDRGSEFAIFQNGELLQTEKVKRASDPIELAIKSNTPGKQAQYSICLPSWSNPKLTSIKIRSGFKINQPVVPELTFAVLGDSISHGTGQGSATYKTWPFLLSQQIDASLYNLAVGGGKISPPTAAMLSEFKRIDLITILVGYNDWNSGVTPDEFQSQYSQVLASIAETHPNAQVVCVTPTFTSRKDSKKSSYKLEDFRQAIRDAVKATDSKKISLFEGTKLTSDENLRADSDDAVHFSEKGARLFAEAVYKELASEELLPVQTADSLKTN